MNATVPDPNRWKALAVVGAAFLMTVLDISIVNVALPTIGKELDFSRDNLQWVVTAYAITFGGFLLLGGRAADLLGRRIVFVVGVVVFTGASLGCGLAGSEGVLIVMRGIQGVGGAIIAPSALSIVGTAFPEGAERNKALGVWGAIGGSGAAIGVILGGLLTQYAGWQWIFFVNIPIGAIALALTPAFVRESRVEVERRRYDPLGAVLITSSIMVLVYAISKAPDAGWGSGRTIGLILASVVLLISFVVTESRVKEPLMPLAIWRLRTVTTANVVGVVVGAVMFSTFFLLTLYTQQVLGYSSLQTGIAMLATALTAMASAGAAEALVTRIGPKRVLTAGTAFMGLGLVWFAQLPVDGQLRAESARPARPDRPRNRLLVRPDLDHRAGRRPRQVAGARLGADEHDAAGGRRRRRRRRLEPLRHPPRERAPEAARAGSGARGRDGAGDGQRLHACVLGARRCGLRRDRLLGRAPPRRAPLGRVGGCADRRDARRLAVLHQPGGDERDHDRRARRRLG